jgi:fused signal recognition particle receptor
MEELSKILNEYFVLLVRLMSQWLRSVAALLGEYGVPEAYREVGALGVFFLLVTLAVGLFILLLLRLTRKRREARPLEGRPVPPAVSEVPTLAEEGPESISVAPTAAEIPQVQEEAVAGAREDRCRSAGES